MTTEFYPLHYNSDVIARCGDCGYTERAGDCEAIKDPGERLSTGDPLPAGECSECGSLSYVEDRQAKPAYDYKADTEAVLQGIAEFEHRTRVTDQCDTDDVLELLGAITIRLERQP